MDPEALSCYAFGLPAALRAHELGDDFKSRITASAPPVAAGGKAAAKPPAKGAAPPANAQVVPTAAWNPLVKDPDDIASSPLPSDPLVVGAFTVLQRIGVVQPSETAAIDVKFDPSGCENSKERLRVFITGADYSEPSAQFLKIFDLSGDSCIPAIDNEDMNGIFEEQEVVSSLAELGNKTSGAGGIEKLAVGKVVYAQEEKVLAFGPIVCNNASGKGLMERIKITNPTKIDTKVKFSISSSAPKPVVDAPPAKDAKGAKGGAAAAAAAAATTSGSSEEQIFRVHPESWDIPPHEHR